MDAVMIAAIIVVVAIVGVIAYWLYSQQHKKDLRQSFGPEYDQAVRQAGSESQAEKELDARRKRIEKLHIKDLSPDQQQRFAEEWRLTQGHFVDDPTKAIGEADGLVIMVMEARGYPVSDFDQQAADISVEHPVVVESYRSAHTIAEKNNKDGASTEELRQAMVHYRTLFDELLGAPRETRMRAAS